MSVSIRHDDITSFFPNEHINDGAWGILFMELRLRSMLGKK